MISENKLLLEAPVFDPGSALKAAKYGVDRIELCSSFSEGGLTPGAGHLSFLKANINIPIFVMIRPRGGDFVSSAEEIDVMRNEIRILSTHGADGFVFGVLHADGTVNQNACGSLIREANSKPCTFHRAFDVSSNLERSLEEIIDCGFQRILTSGGRKSVNEGLITIKKLMQRAGDRIIIMPGGGMKPEFISHLAKTGHLSEVHASCKATEVAPDRYVNEDLQFTVKGLRPNEYLTIDKQKVLDFKKQF